MIRKSVVTWYEGVKTLTEVPDRKILSIPIMTHIVATSNLRVHGVHRQSSHPCPSPHPCTLSTLIAFPLRLPRAPEFCSLRFGPCYANSNDYSDF